MKLKGAVYEYIQTAVLLEILSNINFIMKFIHKDDHSIIIEVLLFDLVRKLWPKKNSILIKLTFASRNGDNF